MGTNTALGAGVHPTGTGPTLVPRTHARSRLVQSIAHLHRRLAALSALSRGASTSQTGLLGSISADDPDSGTLKLPNPDSQFPMDIPRNVTAAVAVVQEAIGSGRLMQRDVGRLVAGLTDGTFVPRTHTGGGLWAASTVGGPGPNRGTGGAHGETLPFDGLSPMAVVVVTADFTTPAELDKLYQGAIDYTLARRPHSETPSAVLHFVRVLRDRDAEPGLPALWTAEAVAFQCSVPRV